MLNSPPPTNKGPNAMTAAPKKAKFTRITEADGYKFIPANKTAEKFCATYGTSKLRATEIMNLKVDPANINWGA